MPVPPLELQAICKRFGAQQTGFGLGPVSLQVAAGEIMSVVGLNGAGKTTLLRVIAGTVLPDSGCVLLEGKAVGSGNARTRMAVVFDGNRSLYWKMTVRENIDYFGALKQQSWRNRGAWAGRVLELAGLESAAAVLVEKLSKGMQQRLVVAINALSEPSVLLLDEPTVGVDVLHLDRIVSIVTQLKQQGCAIVLTSHQLDVIEKLADRALLLEHGEVKQVIALASERNAPRAQRFSVEVAVPLSVVQVSELQRLGATVCERVIAIDSQVTDLYQVFDLIRPNPVLSCVSVGENLEALVRRHAFGKKEAA